MWHTRYVHLECHISWGPFTVFKQTSQRNIVSAVLWIAPCSHTRYFVESHFDVRRLTACLQEGLAAAHRCMKPTVARW
jgi:hypothetical protein